MKYEKQTGPSGAWLDKSTIRNKQKAKIVSETKPIPGNFKNDDGSIKNQDVAKVHFQGQQEAVNVNLNKPTIAGLIDAFGDDSVNWQGRVLTVELEKVRIGGRAVTALYLLPEGYEKADDENGYAVVRKAEIPKETQVEGDYPQEDIDPSAIPF